MRIKILVIFLVILLGLSWVNLYSPSKDFGYRILHRLHYLDISFFGPFVIAVLLFIQKLQEMDIGNIDWSGIFKFQEMIKEQKQGMFNLDTEVEGSP